ncbi:MAG: serine/threonine protein kinase [Phycisphaerales bacterium]|nr:serine/threonine protein kinase [Phycisphaerales bacterium]
MTSPASNTPKRLIEIAREMANDRAEPVTISVTRASGVAYEIRDAIPTFPGYSNVRPLGQGGQGVVYRAKQDGTGRDVAIKALRAGPASEPDSLRRFEREIELVSGLRHPHIVSVFHTGWTLDGELFFVMDFVEGLPLRAAVQSADLSLEDALRLFSKICDAVQFAHGRGVIHRDLKPGNILVDAQGEPRILDFGLARALGDQNDRLTLTNEVMGTLAYMSPEQARGEIDAIDTRTDVYALGVILYEILTGALPFDLSGGMWEALRRVAEGDPAPPTSRWTEAGVTRVTSRRLRRGGCPIDDDVQTIILRAMARDPQRRYQGAGTLADDVRRYLGGEAIEAKRDSKLYVLRKTLRRNMGAVLVALSVLTIGASAASVAITQWFDARRADKVAARESADAQMEADQWVTIAMPTIRRACFAAMLADYRAGHDASAASWAQRLREAGPSAEAKAAEYLAREAATQRDQDELLKSMDVDEGRLVAWLVIGERAARAGDEQAARESFEAALELSPSEWWRPIVLDRVAGAGSE